MAATTVAVFSSRYFFFFFSFLFPSLVALRMRHTVRCRADLRASAEVSLKEHSSSCAQSNTCPLFERKFRTIKIFVVLFRFSFTSTSSSNQLDQPLIVNNTHICIYIYHLYNIVNNINAQNTRVQYIKYNNNNNRNHNII